MPGNAVNGLELAVRIVIPDDPSIGSRIPTQMTIQRSRKDCSGNGRHCRQLCRTAWPTISAARRRCLPHAFAVIEAQREHAASLGGVERVLAITAARR